ncbi:MAG: PIN domain-containing protein [Chloroflexi bacterium]|nr:PIN domain-containing protein [Chloroflexota bacterium]
MAHGLLLLDSSVWVRYLRTKGWEELKAAVQEALARGQVATCWVVNAELLIGARDQTAFETLLEVLRGVPEVAITAAIWEEAARLGHGLRKQGLLLPLPDLVIAQCAIADGRVLWHADGHFEQIRQRSSLRTRDWQTQP